MDDCPCCGASVPVRLKSITKEPRMGDIFICWDCLVSWTPFDRTPSPYTRSAMAGVGLPSA